MGMMIDIGDGLKVPAEVTGSTSFDGYTVDVLAVYDTTIERYVARRIAFAADSGEVTGTVLRMVAVERVLREILANALGAVLSGVHLPERTEGGPTDEMLRYVALTYRFAHLVGEPPVWAVAERLGIPRGTASHWAIRARDRGFLTITSKHGRPRGWTI